MIFARARLSCLAGIVAWLLASSAEAQIPDVIVRIDVLLHYRSEQSGRSSVRAYDSLGNYGTVGLGFTLEPGFFVEIAQRLQKIRGNADDDQLDAIYIEDRGLWKLGKQAMPFGRNGLLKENVYGGRWEATLGSEALPASLAACDGGRGLQRGLIGRIGTRFGFSFAVGNRFGIDASSLTVVRRPEDSPGRHRGYREIYGVDYSRKVGRLDLNVEHASFRRGETALDEEREVTDVLFSVQDETSRYLGFGWSRDSLQRADHFRLIGKWPLGEGAWIEPILQFQEGEVRNFGVSVRIRR